MTDNANSSKSVKISADGHSTSYFRNTMSAPELPLTQRSITGHYENGTAGFMVTDNGGQRAIRAADGCEMAQTTLYGTFNHPVQLNGDDDLSIGLQAGVQSRHHISNGTYVTLLDFAPGAETPMHRGESLDYNIVIEGEFELIMDSGEVRRMGRGDVNVQRATAHKWRNVSGEGSKPGRLFTVLVDVAPMIVGGKSMEGFLDGFDGRYGFGTGRAV